MTREWPDKFKIIEAGEGASGCNDCIVTPLLNLKKEQPRHSGLLHSSEGIYVLILKRESDNPFTEVGRIWRISIDAEIETVV